MNSREKGKRREREAAEWWRAHGHKSCQRGKVAGCTADDLIDPPGIHVEVKGRGAIAHIYEWLDQAARDGGLRMPVVMAKADRKRWFFAVDGQAFIALYEAWLAQSGKTYSEVQT